MPEYLPLAPQSVISSADSTGVNPGNLSAVFSSGQLPLVGVFEIYHMAIKSGPVLGSASIWTAGRQWSTVTLGLSGENEWDPNQPILMKQSEEIWFLWSLATATTTKIPVVTIWPRFDATLPVNQAAAGLRG